ncbi:oxidoreductase-like domain-containing protein 1 [Plakobranchus ocellatus]|uniref:Oxidoreductase-like domain-containing protein 1 n=1 Tax=Plakobranchus ocellatus TaxID=259542 RepID=A0AAV4D5W0_9GAST|nr:oxidoreductase-like domain-containing protein 1 [Plakobranchus ocellatus]
MERLQAFFLTRIAFPPKVSTAPGLLKHFRKECCISSTNFNYLHVSSKTCNTYDSHSKVSKSSSMKKSTINNAASDSSEVINGLESQASELDTSSDERERNIANLSSEAEVENFVSSSNTLRKDSQSNLTSTPQSHDLQSKSTPSALKTVTVVPGKGLPPEPPTTCCGTGCANCVWIAYAEELKEYYKDGGEQARKALENIDDQSLKMFIKLELGL